MGGGRRSGVLDASLLPSSLLPPLPPPAHLGWRLGICSIWRALCSIFPAPPQPSVAVTIAACPGLTALPWIPARLPLGPSWNASGRVTAPSTREGPTINMGSSRVHGTETSRAVPRPACQRSPRRTSRLYSGSCCRTAAPGFIYQEPLRRMPRVLRRSWASCSGTTRGTAGCGSPLSPGARPIVSALAATKPPPSRIARPGPAHMKTRSAAATPVGAGSGSQRRGRRASLGPVAASGTRTTCKTGASPCLCPLRQQARLQRLAPRPTAAPFTTPPLACAWGRALLWRRRGGRLWPDYHAITFRLLPQRPTAPNHAQCA